MTIAVYQRGDMVRVTGIFRDVNGTLVDPTTVSFEYTKPDGTAVSKTHPDTIVKDSTGTYHIDVSADTVGLWLYAWVSSGSGQAAEPGEFFVSARGA